MLSAEKAGLHVLCHTHNICNIPEEILFTRNNLLKSLAILQRVTQKTELAPAFSHLVSSLGKAMLVNDSQYDKNIF